MHAHRDRRARKGDPLSGDHGYSLVEIMVVVGVIAVAGAITAVMLPGASRTAAADGEMQRITTALRGARDAAVTQRRNVIVSFPSTSQLAFARQDVSNGAVTGTTPLGMTTLESGFTFQLMTGVPDTPDGFGAGSALSFGGASTVLFTSEGEFVDQTGDPVNGSIFIGQRSDRTSARAVTILGVTGLVNGYRWDGRQWVR